MGSINWNLFNINSFCSTQSDDGTTEFVKEYEDKHIRIISHYTKEKVNGKIKNETNKVSIYNKDGYYNPNALISNGNNYYLSNGD